jgi:RHS repeat-associated protein
VASSVSEYDPIGRLKQTTSPMNVNFAAGLLSGTPATITETGSLIGPLFVAYQDGGNPWTIVVTDETGAASGLTRKFGLDGFGRTNVIYDVFNTTPYATNRFVHDRLGRVTNLVDAAGNKIEYAYNDLGQMVAMADPNLGYWTYERDYAGRVKVHTDGKGNTVAFNYTDPLGRLVGKTITPAGGGSGYSVTYAYDAPDTGGFTVFAGQLAKVTDQEGVERYSYDVRGRTLKVARTLTVNSTTYTSEFLHDQADRQISVKYPNSGPTVTNRYDLGGNLTQVQRVDPGGSTLYFQSKGYSQLGELLGATFGNGTEINYTYFPKTRRLQNLASKKTGAATNFQALAYTYNQVGDLTAITDSLYSGTNSATISSVAYDNLHRLTALTRPGPVTTTYTYNALGNLLTNGEQGGSTYTYPTTGLLPHAVRIVGTKTHAYDLVGNMVQRGVQILNYDAENRLARVVAGGITLATFGYDDGGERLWKQSTNTLHVWIGSLYEARGTTNLFHVFAGSRRIATFSPGTQLPGASGTTAFHYYHPDHLGSSSLITDAGGLVAEHYEYSAYGRERANGTAAPDVSHRFTGQIFDAEIGLYYYGARYYDADLGRFIQADTIIPDVFDPQSWNRYAYALNNPLKYTDPTGHVVETVWDVANIGIGLHSLWGNIKEGNVGAAILDGLGVVGDSIATAVPFVPGGLGTLIKGGRIGDKALDAAAAANKLDTAKDAGKGLDKAADASLPPSNTSTPRWEPGDSPHAPTRVSDTPSDSTVRRREWRNEAQSPTRSDFTPEEIDRMQRGKPPQRYNPDKRGTESMERSHEPVPKRDGGKETVPRWPQEHAEVDPKRRPGY